MIKFPARKDHAMEAVSVRTARTDTPVTMDDDMFIVWTIANFHHGSGLVFVTRVDIIFDSYEDAESYALQIADMPWYESCDFRGFTIQRVSPIPAPF